jgi:Zn-dependent peptidase ImmA (M78 family)/DNA-binding XRE family transcriptional regulator
LAAPDVLEPSLEATVVSSQQLGDRIAPERRRRDLTQADLAAQLGVSRQTVIAIEKGERRPSSEELVRIAELLKTSLHDLVKESRAAGGISPRFRLGLDKAPDGDELRNSVDLLEKLGRWYVELERINGIEREKAPLESLETYRSGRVGAAVPKRAAEDAARTVRGSLGLNDGPAGEIEPRLEAEAGLRIFRLDLPSAIAGIFVWGDEIGACVAVNRRHPRDRQTWSLMHEAGHFLRDREAGDILHLQEPTRADASEVFADSFAKEFLLPSGGVARHFDQVVRTNGGRFRIVDVLQMARTFGVSFEAICHRLEDLELLPAGTHDRLRRQKFKVRKTEADLGLTVAPQPISMLPERYITLALAAYEAEKLSEGSLAEYLLEDRVAARRIYLERRRLRDEDQVVDTDLGVDVLSLTG